MPAVALDSVDKELLLGKLDDAEIADLETCGSSRLPSRDESIQKILAIILVDYCDQLSLWSRESHAMYHCKFYL